MSLETEARLRHLTRVLNRIEILKREQIRLEDERDAILAKLRRFGNGDSVVFDGLVWEVGSCTARLSAGSAQVHLRLRRGGSKVNPKQTKHIPIEQQHLCQPLPANPSK